MKKTAVKRFLAFVVIVGIFLAVIGILSSYSRSEPSMPSFEFLNGRKPAYHCINNSQYQYSITQDIYSFEADSNDIFPKANSELLALGFVDMTDTGQWHRDYELRTGLPYERIWVRIYKKHKLSVYSTPESSDYSSPDRYEFHTRDGWVSVEVRVAVAKWGLRIDLWLDRIF
jgi:hypothetical protein